MRATRVVTLTWVSWSWKSTLVSLLKEDGFKSPIQFTTRQERGDKEKDEYVFLTKPTFYRKLENGDFAEFARFGWEMYAVGKYFPEGDVVIIVDPVGKEAIKKYCNENWIYCKSFFLDITMWTMVERLSMYRRECVKFIEGRKKDFLSFSPVWYDFVIDANNTTEVVYRKLKSALMGFGFRSEG